MLKDKYLEKIKGMALKHLTQDKVGVFIFGSSLRRNFFGDVDLGVMGEVDGLQLGDLREELEESSLPYFVDVIDFNNVKKSFRENVFNNKILWIKHLH